MKREALDHPKLWELELALVRLGAPQAWVGSTAVGVLERLWIFTAKHAPAGDVGRHSDEAIARACRVPEGLAEDLVEALVRIRLLDDDPIHRLAVHGWAEHADDAVHRKVARARAFFTDGSAPRLARLNRDERPEAEAFYAGHNRQPRLPYEPTPGKSGRPPGARVEPTRSTLGASPAPPRPARSEELPPSGTPVSRSDVSSPTTSRRQRSRAGVSEPRPMLGPDDGTVHRSRGTGSPELPAAPPRGRTGRRLHLGTAIADVLGSGRADPEPEPGAPCTSSASTSRARARTSRACNRRTAPAHGRPPESARTGDA